MRNMSNRNTFMQKEEAVTYKQGAKQKLAQNEFFTIELEYGIEKEKIFELIKPAEIMTMCQLLTDKHSWLTEIKIENNYIIAILNAAKRHYDSCETKMCSICRLFHKRLASEKVINNKLNDIWKEVRNVDDTLLRQTVQRQSVKIDQFIFEKRKTMPRQSKVN